VAVATQGAELAVGSSAALTLPWPIGAFVVGVTLFQYQFPYASQHSVAEVALSVSANMTSANTIAVTPNGIMKDASGNYLDGANSLVIVGALAWSQDDASVAEITVPGIASGTASPAAQIPPGSAILASQAILTGFDIVRPGNHHVQSIQASVSSNLFSPPAASIRGMASLQDASGNVDTSATVDGAYFCSYNIPEYELATWIGATQTPVNTQSTETVTFASAPSAVALFLTGFSMAYPQAQDQEVGFMVAGATKLTMTATGASFIPQAAMASGPLQSNPAVATGTVSLVAVGIP